MSLLHKQKSVLTSLIFCFATCVYAESIPTTIEARFSYFWPESSQVRKIYGQGWVDYQLTGTIPVYQGPSFAGRGFNVWWAADYLSKQGHSLGLHNKTSIQVEPLTLGFKWICPQFPVRPFLGMAFKYSFVQTHNSSSFVKSHVNTSAPGFVVETGIQAFLAKYLLLDLFVSYSYLHIGPPSIHRSNVSTTHLDLGGLNAGGGLGVKF